ncbi:MAG: DUF433 domain-containing protein [Acidobacteria bacterium]|nr:DUF433 domain-containing protein [Acidobacteriota bacterium]
MIQLETTQTVPLTLWEEGTIRIIDSRVTLDVILHAYLRGESPEEIHEGFPSLRLRDIYGAIYYYLEHKDQVHEYLREQERMSEETRRFIESEMPSDQWRERMREIRDQQRNSSS